MISSRTLQAAALGRGSTFHKLGVAAAAGRRIAVLRSTAGDAMNNSSADSYPALLSLAVHEFRTPVSVVGGYLRMLQRDDDPPMSERQRRMVDEAEKSCARLVTLIAELSEIGKLDGGTIAIAKQPVDLFPLVAEVAEHVHEARERDVRLMIRGEPDGARVDGDAARLRSTFDAIFRAILREKAGPSTVVAERRRETLDGRVCAVVVVADDGSVQAAYDGPAGVFDERRGGMGLALPLARRVVQQHGGRIWSPASEPLSRTAAIVAIPIN
jgi:signal transduction histidine kinase